MGRRLQTLTDIAANWVATWLSSRAAFIQVIVVTVLWLPLVLYGIDKHGFIYLYLATALSLITQVPLAMIAAQAKLKAEAGERHTLETLAAILATMTALQALISAVRVEIEEQDKLIEEIHDEVFEDDTA